MGPLQGTHVLADGRIAEIPVLCDDSGRLVAVAPDQIPRLSVTPEGVTSPGSSQFGDGSNELRYLRVIVNAGDDVVAGAKLLSGEGCAMLIAERSYVLTANVPITRLDVVAIGDALSSGSPPAKGTLVDEAGTEAEIRNAMRTYTFSADDNVRSVVIVLSQFYSTSAAVATATNFVMSSVEGRSHA